MIRALSNFFTTIMQRWLPDAFIFAIILTFIVFLAGVLGESKSPSEMVNFWGGGVWNLLVFSMQVTVSLVTGSVLAQTTAVKRVLRALASLAKNPSQAILLMTVISLLCGWISWAFGLIASALMAREIARHVKGVHYPLLVASAYSGMVIWHAGLSGSIPLKIAVSDGDVLSTLMNGTTIPLNETIFSWQVLVICALVLLTLPVIFRLMMPTPEDTQEVDPKQLGEVEEVPIRVNTPSDRIEHSRLPTLLLGLLGGYYLVEFFLAGGSVGLNTLNLIFLVCGLLLHRSTTSYLFAVNEAVKGLSGIVLQFPLYAGIMGMMAQSGLAASVSAWFIDISTADTFNLFTFLSAGVVNFFVPSGGGQWAVQAPIVIPAAQSLGIPLNQAAMAVAFGDAWTNMVQPFWALPLLGIARLGIRDIMGYCTVALLWTGLLFGLSMVFIF
ncbi:MAG: short-chain fatty acid transporter [Gammaproteobacteria bacterium]|nr:MAG: short-chain fatty acid transporter [Gammaproteobacteria bacterium]